MAEKIQIDIKDHADINGSWPIIVEYDSDHELLSFAHDADPNFGDENLISLISEAGPELCALELVQSAQSILNEVNEWLLEVSPEATPSHEEDGCADAKDLREQKGYAA